jgi:hypothetical protein
MTVQSRTQLSCSCYTKREFPGFDFFAPSKQTITLPDNVSTIDRSISLSPSMRGGWRMRVKLASGRYKYSYFERGEWKSKASERLKETT